VSGGAVGIDAAGLDLRRSRFAGQTHHAVRTSAFATVTDSDFEECGIACVVAGELTLVTRNIFRGAVGGGGTAVRLGDLAIASFNLIEGSGTPTDPDDRSTWPFAAGALLMDGGGAAQAMGNVVRGAGVAFASRRNGAGSAMLAGWGNIVENVHTVALSIDDGAFALRRNDFSAHSRSIDLFEPTRTSTPAAGSLTCNFWGSVDGPLNPHERVVAEVYTPFATEPIAGVGRTC
jgi:hypothetical protein